MPSTIQPLRDPPTRPSSGPRAAGRARVVETVRARERAGETATASRVYSSRCAATARPGSSRRSVLPNPSRYSPRRLPRRQRAAPNAARLARPATRPRSRPCRRQGPSRRDRLEPAGEALASSSGQPGRPAPARSTCRPAPARSEAGASARQRRDPARASVLSLSATRVSHSSRSSESVIRVSHPSQSVIRAAAAGLLRSLRRPAPRSDG